MEEYLQAAEDDMKSAVEALGKDLQKIRTGRATPKLLENVQVEVQSYGATMPLNQLATVQAADARLLVVTPWDKATLQDVERGIVAAGLGLNPSNDGQILRVPIPPLTADRRRDLVKQLHTMGEDAKVRVRHVRREYNETFKEGEESGDITEDQLTRYLDKVQKLTDDYVDKIDAVCGAKEKEVVEV
jgi:ribosome recycling factor